MTGINPYGHHLAALPVNAAKSPINSINGTAKAEPEANAGIKAMAADFEAIFIRQMLSTMRTSSLGEGLFDSQASAEFRDMQDAQIADSMAEKGVFGVAELLTRHLDKTGVTGNSASQTGGEQK